MIHKLLMPGNTALYFEDQSPLSTPLRELHSAFKLQNRDGIFLSWLVDEKQLRLIGSSYDNSVDDEFELPE